MSFFRRIFGNDEDTQTNTDSANSDDLSSKKDDSPVETTNQSSNNLAEEATLPPEVLEKLVEDEEDDNATLPDRRELIADTAELDPDVIQDELDKKESTTPETSDDEPADFQPGLDGVTRPLPQEPTMQKGQEGHLLFGQASDQGMVRDNNQDSAVSFFFTSESVDDHPDFGMFIIADGMGGHIHGEKASALTARIVAAEVMQSIYIPLLNGVDINSADRPTIAEALNSAVKKANSHVIREVPDGGTTITAIVILNNLAHIAHVGDSRAYLITEEKGVEQITRDHSLVQRLIELDQLKPEEAATHDQRNVLYRAIGQSDDIEVDTLTRRLPYSSHVLICSDGLWGLVEEADLQDIIMNTTDPQESCEKLIALANTQGGTDNISAILIKMPNEQ